MRIEPGGGPLAAKKSARRGSYSDLPGPDTLEAARRRIATPEGPPMASQDDGSVTRWIGDLQGGGDSAAQHLWERYFHRLVHLARARLHATRRAGAIEDEEDAALSAFDSFCRGAAAGRLPRLADRDDLWRLLVVITVRKVLAQLQRQGARKRGGGRLLGESALIGVAAAEGCGL